MGNNCSSWLNHFQLEKIPLSIHQLNKKNKSIKIIPLKPCSYPLIDRTTKNNLVAPSGRICWEGKVALGDWVQLDSHDLGFAQSYCLITLYHGTSPLNYHLGESVFLFTST